MERRHQVFISSTFSDLRKERAEVVQALLELDCFPAGMEIFPAASEAAWDLIKGVIDDSDYYLLIIGGRYGSLDDVGIGYTEKEYNYAISVKKPVVAFLHQTPGDIPLAKSEGSEAGRVKLEAFRNKVESSHHCKYWTSAEDLGGKVSRSLIALRKQHPSDGWVPGAYAQDESSLLELSRLRARVAELEGQLAKRASDESSLRPQDIADGSDIFSSHVYFENKERVGNWLEINLTWDSLLRYVGPALLGECDEDMFIGKLKLCFFHTIQASTEDVNYDSVVIPQVSVDQIKIQLRALGYMTPGTKRRAVADKKSYWKLTATGESRLITMQSIRKPPVVPPDIAE